MINNQYEIKYIIIQVLLTFLIALIPIYFYLDASFENQSIKDKMDLKNYANLVVSKMQDFEKENTQVFHYPRSNIFTSAILDKNNKELFSLLGNENIFFYEEFKKVNTKICY